VRIGQGLSDDTSGHVVFVAGRAAIRIGALHKPVGCVVAPGDCAAAGVAGPFNSPKTVLTVTQFINLISPLIDFSADAELVIIECSGQF
jgi:hypothetical protein